MNDKNDEYISAFSYDFLTPAYDFIMQYAMHETAFKNQLMKQVKIDKGQRVLDLGCGTATLTILIKKNHPETQVVGIDGDHKILEVARAKAEKVGVDMALDHGMVFELPYPDNSFDRVVSCLVFHHLNCENKVRSLKEAFRVLKPQGELHILDFGKPQSFLMYLISLVMSRLEENMDNVKGILPEMIRKIGFDQVEEMAKFQTIFGTIASYGARKPGTLVLSNE